MKTPTIISLTLGLLLLTGAGCDDEKDKEKSTVCQGHCADAFVSENIDTQKGKIVILRDERFNLDKTLIDIDPDFLNKEGFSAKDETLLVPCNLNDNFEDGDIVVITGKKLECCGIVSLPNVRPGFGCQFEIISIELVNNIN